MKRKDMYSTVHFHVSSFVHVHFSINNRYDEVYGYRRIADELMSEFGIRASRKYVLHRMRTLGIRSRIRKIG